MLRIHSLFTGLMCILAVTTTAAATATASAPHIQFETSVDSSTVEMYLDKTPKTIASSLQYVKDGFYEDMIFHHVMNDLMIQGNDFTPGTKQEDTCPPIEIESKNGLKNDKYTIVTTRIVDPNSATAQFYVNVVNNSMPNYPDQSGYSYTAFGKVVKGIGVTDRIRAVEITTEFPRQNVPMRPVAIESATVVFR